MSRTTASIDAAHNRKLRLQRGACLASATVERRTVTLRRRRRPVIVAEVDVIRIGLVLGYLPPKPVIRVLGERAVGSTE
jgi:hypothetical protein